MPSDALAAYLAHRERLDALEPAFIPKVKRALLRSIERALLAAEQGVDARTAAAFVDRAPIEKVLSELYVKAGTREARVTYDQLTAGQKALAPPAIVSRWGQRLKGFITEGAAAVKGITDTTRKLVRSVLREAAEAGDGVAVAAKKLRQAVQAIAPERAVAIVRTELVAAGNFGSIIGAQSTGLQLEKFWIATPDGRTRQSHASANGQGAPLQEGFFTVGGEHCRYPGDPLLSAGERINCRCAIGYRKPVNTP